MEAVETEQQPITESDKQDDRIFPKQVLADYRHISFVNYAFGSFSTSVLYFKNGESCSNPKQKPAINDSGFLSLTTGELRFRAHDERTQRDFTSQAYLILPLVIANPTAAPIATPMPTHAPVWCCIPITAPITAPRAIAIPTMALFLMFGL